MSILTSEAGDFLLLDFGGTDIKATVSCNGNLDSIKRQNVSSCLKKEGKKRFYIAQELEEIVSDFLESYSGRTFTGILISTQMACAQILGGKSNGELIVSWQDAHSQPTFDALPLEARIAAGNDLKVGSPVISSLGYQPDEKLQTSVSLDTLGGFLAKILSPEVSDLRHVTDAFALGGYTLPDFSEAQFSSEIGLPRVTSQLQEIGISTVFGGSRVFTPVGDQQASLFGVGLGEDEVAVNIGTGGQVARVVREFNYNADYQTRPYFQDLFLATVTHLPAGRLVAEYFEIWRQSFKFSFREFLEFSSPHVDIPASIPPLELDVSNKKGLVDASLAHMHVPHSLPTELSKTLATIYAKAIEEVDPGGKKKIVFAGGLGSAYSDLQKRISQATCRAIRVSSSPETTISGLSKLARTSKT